MLFNKIGSIMGSCYSVDHIAEDLMHTDISCYIEKLQQKYCLGTIGNYFLGEEGGGEGGRGG